MNSTWLKARMYHQNVTQKQIGEAWRVDHSQVSRWLKAGYALPVERMRSLAALLGMEMPDLLEKLEEADQPTQPSDHEAETMAAAQTAETPLIEVRDSYGEVVDRVPAPPRLTQVPGAYAVLVQDAKLAPRARPGDTLYIHPALPAAPGDLCVDQDGHIKICGTKGSEGYRKVVTIDCA